MRNTSLLLLLALTPGILLGQKQVVPVNSDYERPRAAATASLSPALMQQLTAIRDAALTDEYAYRQVAHITENIGPRAVGSPQAQAAIEYVAGEMRKLGLDVHLEPVQARHWIRGAESAELVEDLRAGCRNHPEGCVDRIGWKSSHAARGNHGGRHCGQ